MQKAKQCWGGRLSVVNHVSIVVQSQFNRSHSQVSHIKFEDTPLSSPPPLSFRSGLPENKHRDVAGFNSRGLGRHLGLWLSAWTTGGLINRAKVFLFSLLSKCLCSVHTICVRSCKLDKNSHVSVWYQLYTFHTWGYNWSYLTSLVHWATP